VVVLDEDVMEVFPDSDWVNGASALARIIRDRSDAA
jgi:hypothetical protein